jgi:hypothetical protein
MQNNDLYSLAVSAFKLSDGLTIDKRQTTVFASRVPTTAITITNYKMLVGQRMSGVGETKSHLILEIAIESNQDPQVKMMKLGF